MQLISMLRGIANGMQYLAKLNYVHKVSPFAAAFATIILLHLSNRSIHPSIHPIGLDLIQFAWPDLIYLFFNACPFGSDSIGSNELKQRQVCITCYSAALVSYQALEGN